MESNNFSLRESTESIGEVASKTVRINLDLRILRFFTYFWYSMEDFLKLHILCLRSLLVLVNQLNL